MEPIVDTSADVVVEPQVEVQTGLPSDNVEVDFTGFELNDEIKGKFKNGKLNGRFSSVQDVLDKLKEAEDFKSATISEQKKSEVKADKQGVDAQVKQTQTEVINELIPSFMENGMQLTPEMEAKITETGVDIRDLKLGAIELRDTSNRAYGLVGGKEEYTSMMTHMSSTMNEGEKQRFNAMLSNPMMSEFAIKGMHDAYKTAITNGEPINRIEGNSTNVGLQPYEDRRSLYKNMDYLDTPAGRRDTAAKNKHQARLKITSKEVLGM